MSQRFLEHARIEADKGDDLQVSEKAWGAMGHALKAIVEQRGWNHQRRQHIIETGSHPGREFDRVGDSHLHLGSARTMNQNFYENEAPEGAIRQSIEYGLGFRLLLGVWPVVPEEPHPP